MNSLIAMALAPAGFVVSLARPLLTLAAKLRGFCGGACKDIE